LKKVSLSDPDCRIMKTKKKITEPSYNAQLVLHSRTVATPQDEAAPLPHLG